MKWSAVALFSVLGMGSSSAAVTWLTPPTSAPRSAARVHDAPAPGSRSAPAPADPGQPVVAAPEPAPPTFSLSGPLRLEGRLGHASLPADRPAETFLMVEVGAPEGAAIESRAPVNVSIVIDRSGSMKGQRLTNAIAAARGMVDRLRADDTISMVAYSDRAELLIAPTTIDRLDRLSFERALAGLRGDGHTCMSCGIDLAREQIRRRRGTVNRILLLSDGVANRGMTTPLEFRALGDQARFEQTSVASIGVDLDYDERTLFALSQASNGHHYFVENPSGLPAVFDREAVNLTGTIADRVDVEVQLAEGVELVDVVSRGHRREGDRVFLSMGSFNAGDDRSAVLRVRLEPGRGEQPVADVRLAYRDLMDGRERETAGRLGLRLDPSQTRVAELDAKVEERLGRKDTLDALLGANEAFARGDLAVARRQLDDARQEIQSRRTRAAPTPGSAIDRSFEEQLQALGGAQASFDEAAREAPKAASKSRKGKAAVKLNTEAANPFL